MKTTFDLPEPLLRRAKAAAAHQGRPLRDLVAEAIDAKLVADSAFAPASTPAPAPASKSATPDHGWKAFAARLVKQADGTWVNPEGTDDERFFQALEDIRAESRRSPRPDPFADFGPEDQALAAAAPQAGARPRKTPDPAAVRSPRKRRLR